MGLSVRLSLCLVPLVLLVSLPPALGTPLVAGNVATNELIDPPPQEETDLAYCRSGSVCGYLQVNAYGVNAKQFCRCPSIAGACGLHWDPQDGRSITMGSEQFKFCGAPPPLHVCGRDEPSYSAAFIFDSATFSMSGEQHRLHCYCPPPMAHVRADMVEDVVDGELIMATVHACSRLPACAEETACKEVALASGTALVYPKCRCPREFSCPTLGTSVAPHSNNYPRGSAYSVFCQRRF
ncbi:U-scoloptoxin(11)-Sm5a-like [Penaeus japonicus]|uniref:U-scoloptoxin(11)-Sm5a-like n=1 Tax=Penaeus japonicus TaxID=27405 RepID=UPI001C70E6CC|nr:U-scoloptoxin(11)-Sm5a-like [Penaeus japonicus]